jgi:hypothetical protein
MLFVSSSTDRPNAEFKRWPLSADPQLQDRIIRNMPHLSEMIEPDQLLVLFWSRGCINNRHKIELECTKKSKRCDKLLSMLLKRSVEDFYIFVECLEQSEQDHLIDIFLYDGSK